MHEKHLCDYCKDPKNPVTPANGGAIGTRIGGITQTLAYVHKSCKDAWAQAHGGTTFDGLPWPSFQETVHCTKCGKAFEVVGMQGSETQLRAEGVSCPYENCGQPNEVMWPKNQPFFVRLISSEI